MRLAFTNALDLVGMQAVDLAATLTLPLRDDRFCLIERPFEDRVELFVAGDLTLDVADGRPRYVLSLRSALPARLNCFAWAYR